jgi:hypothetical protein
VLNDPKYLMKYKKTVVPEPKGDGDKNKERVEKFRAMQKDIKPVDTEKEEEPLQTDIEETTTSASSGSFSTPHAFSKDPNKPKFGKKSIFVGGTIVDTMKESKNYLTNPKFFEDYINKVNESFNETHLDSKEGKVGFILGKKPNEYKIEDLDKMQDTEVDKIYTSVESETGMNEENNNVKDSKSVEKKVGAEFEDPDGYAKITKINPDGSFEAEVQNVKHKFTRSFEADGSFIETSKHDIKEMNKLSEDFVGFFTNKLKETGKSLKDMSPEEKRAFFLAVDKEYKGKNEKVTEMIGANEPSESPMISKSSENATDPTNLGSGGGAMSEAKKLPNVVMTDRLRGENQKNFNKDLKNNDAIQKAVKSTVKKVDKEDGYIPATDAMSYQDIEDADLKKTKGESFKNVGNSANLKGDEIPKRNETDKEKEQVMLNRGAGMEDLRYGNEVGERFEERMKKEMGYKYDERLKKQEYQKKMVSYNKDAQPTVGKKEYKKDIEKIDEAMTGYYINDLGKREFITFNLNETKSIEKIGSTLKKLSVEGLGNGYGARLEVMSESVVGLVKSVDFYINESNEVFSIDKPKQKVTESKNFEKFKHLYGYKTNEFVDSKKNII